MFDTNLVVVGNVLAAPEWRRIESSGALVANFRIASTARRYDRESSRWVDGNSLRVRVIAWRRLAEGVAASITVGDPVIVYGRIYTREWKDDNGNHRLSYEMEAFSIGHDLGRGRARFFRTRAGQGGGVLEDAEAEALVSGELSVAVAAGEVPVGYGEGLADGEEPAYAEPLPDPEPDDEELAREVSRLVAEQSQQTEESQRAGQSQQAEQSQEAEPVEQPEPAPAARRTRRTRREPVAA